MTPEQKAKLNTMTDAELYQVLLGDLVKAEACLLLERSLERVSGAAMTKLEKALAGVRASIKLTKELMRRG